MLMAERTTGHVDQEQISYAWTLSAFTVGTVFVGLLLRGRVLSGLNEMLLRDPNDASALGRWQRLTGQSLNGVVIDFSPLR
jgi:hypothetical protein